MSMSVLRQICLPLVFFLFAVSAKAESIYFHLGAGQATLASEYTTSENPEAYLGLVGYRITDKWGVEVARYAFGKMGTPAVGLELQTKATSINMVRMFEFQEPNRPLFNVLLKGGYAKVTTDAKGIPAGLALQSKTTKSGLTYGLGVRVALDEIWTLRADIDSQDTGITGLGRALTITGGIGVGF
jgi:Outer membrane protein beta-barrel domain